MNNSKLILVCMLMLISLTLVGCGTSGTTKEDTNTETIASVVYSDNYQSFTPELLSTGLASGKQVVLFFAADWCPLCVKLNKDLNANLASIPDNLLILTIDYDNSQELQKAYNISSQHTLVYLDQAGEVLKSNIKKEVTLDDVMEQIQTLSTPKNADILEPAQENIAREEDITENTNKNQTITSSEILYAAKVGDSIEAHPAWLTVTVTLDDDVISGLDIQQKHSSPKSQRHQGQFAQQIQSVVVGKKLSESNNVYLSVASSTSWAFNDAIKEIQDVYQQSQG